MSKIEDLHMLVRLLNEFGLPISPILEYAIKKKEEELRSKERQTREKDSSQLVNEPVSTIIELNDTSLKEEFRNYLYKEVSQKTAYSYLRYIDSPIRKYINDLVDKDADSIYSYGTVAAAGVCVLKLKLNDRFVEDNLRQHHALTAALTRYIKFLESKENT